MSKADDILEIERLYAIFIHATDRRDFPLLRAIYADDATEDHGEFQGGVDDYIEYARKSLEQFDIATHIYNKPLLTIAGDTAEAVVTGTIFLHWKGPPAYKSLTIVRVFDRFTRTPAGWKFQHRSLAHEHSHKFPPSERLRLGSPLGTMDRSDPIYTELPRLVAELEDYAARFRSDET